MKISNSFLNTRHDLIIGKKRTAPANKQKLVHSMEAERKAFLATKILPVFLHLEANPSDLTGISSLIMQSVMNVAFEEYKGDSNAMAGAREYCRIMQKMEEMHALLLQDLFPWVIYLALADVLQNHAELIKESSLGVPAILRLKYAQVINRMLTCIVDFTKAQRNDALLEEYKRLVLEGERLGQILNSLNSENEGEEYEKIELAYDSVCARSSAIREQALESFAAQLFVK